MIVATPTTTPVLSPLLGMSASLALYPGWETDSLTHNQMPCGHATLTECCTPSNSRAARPVPSSVTAHPWLADYDLDCKALCSLSPSTPDDLTVTAEQLAAADRGHTLGRAFQLGMNTPYGAQPGLSTLPVVIDTPSVPGGCGVRVLTCDLPTPGSPFSLAEGVTSLLAWWSDRGHAGTPNVLAADSLAGVLAQTGLTEPSAVGIQVIAAGNARLGMVPGFDAQIGPGGQIAPAGTAWIWITGGFYAAISPGPTEIRTDPATNSKAIVVSSVGVHSFGACCHAAALVKVCP
jgi:hypothetical protein